VVSSTLRPHFIPGKDPVPILQEAVWAPGQVWTGGKTRPHRDSIPDRPARSQSLYRLSYPARNNDEYTDFLIGKFRGQLKDYQLYNERVFTLEINHYLIGSSESRFL